ncbi:MAG: hypothetical protein CMG80_05330 [Marinobacter sp.]|nr:hypothetical protein [Marinobacter sp.]
MMKLVKVKLIIIIHLITNKPIMVMICIVAVKQRFHFQWTDLHKQHIELIHLIQLMFSIMEHKYERIFRARV